MSKFKFNVKANRFRAELVALSRRIGQLGVDETNRAFDSQSWMGVRWQAAKRTQSHPLLQRTGRMRASVRVRIANRDRVVWGAGVDYAKYHNAGTKHIPQRRFIGMTPRLSRLIALEISRTFKRSMQK